MLDCFSLTGKKALVISRQGPNALAAAEGLQKAGAEVWFAGAAPEPAAFPVAGVLPYARGGAEELASAVLSQMRKLDIVVYDTLSDRVDGWKQDFYEINEQLQATQFDMMCVIQALGRIMAQQGFGSVILMTDYGALVGYDVCSYAGCPDLIPQAFSLVRGFVSGGVVNYARQASNYLAEHGCRCNAIACAPMDGSCPDAFRDAFVRHSQVKRLMTAEDLMSAAVFLASDASAYITGITLPVDGGYTAK